MGEAKPTSGTAYNKREGYSTVYVFVPIGRGLVQEVAACGPTEAGQEEQQANADLITEAFTVHDTTGLTPSQLVEQRDELVDRVKELEETLRQILQAPQDTMSDGKALKDIVRKARAALSKARPNTAEGEAQAVTTNSPAEIVELLECSGCLKAHMKERALATVTRILSAQHGGEL